MEIAHKIGMRTSATMMFGHVETKSEIIEHLFRLRELSKEDRGLHRFHPLDIPAEEHRTAKHRERACFSRFIFEGACDFKDCSAQFQEYSSLLAHAGF